jgi:hypothetical protein
MKAKAVAIGLVVMMAAIPAGAVNHLTIRVSPTVCFEPANLIIRTVVERDKDNRAMEIVAESPAFYRASHIQLDGDNAPRTNTFEFHSLPSGTYEITARLFDARGRARAEVSQQVSVMATSGDGGR